MTERRFHSPFLALLWKEWRESWWLLILTALAPLAGPAVEYWRYERTVTYYGETIALIVTAGAAALLAARLFAGEAVRGTVSFLEALPAGKEVIWRAKLTLPALAVAAGFFACLPFALFRGFPVDDLPMSSPFGLLQTALLAFAVTALFSVLLDRPITALAAGGVIAITVWVGNLWLFCLIPTVWPDTGFAKFSGKPDLMWLMLWLILWYLEPLAILWVSRRVYVRWGRA